LQFLPLLLGEEVDTEDQVVFQGKGGGQLLDPLPRAGIPLVEEDDQVHVALRGGVPAGPGAIEADLPKVLPEEACSRWRSSSTAGEIRWCRLGDERVGYMTLSL